MSTSVFVEQWLAQSKQSINIHCMPKNIHQEANWRPTERGVNSENPAWLEEGEVGETAAGPNFFQDGFLTPKLNL